MLKNALLRWLQLLPLTDVASDGSGGGGQGAGQQSAGQQGAGDAGAGAAALKLTDDSLVDFGDGKPVKWSEARESRFIPRERYDRGVEYLTGEARRLEDAWQKYYRGEGRKPTQPQPSQQQAPNPMDEVRGLPVIGGEHLDKIVQHLYNQGLGPIAQAVAAIAQKNSQLEQRLQQVAGTTGSLAERDLTANFEQDVTKAITEVGEIKGLGMLDPKNDALREFAKDVYLSHDQNSWKPGEFTKMVKARIEGVFALVKSMQKAEVEASKERRKAAFLNPQRGAGTGSGEPGYKHQTGTDLARALFGSMEQST